MTKTFLTNEDMAHFDMQFQQLIEARYATLYEAIEQINPIATGMIGTYGDHIILFDDVVWDVAAADLTIGRDCTLNLNGHKIIFAAAGAYLDVTAKVTIDGTVAGSAIVKHGVTASGTEKLVQANGGHLTIIGGTYSITDITAGFATAIRAENVAETELTMNGCTVIAKGLGSTRAFCVVAQKPTTINDCTLTAEAESHWARGINSANANPLVVSNSSIHAEATNADVHAIYCNNTSATITATKVFARAWSREHAVCGVALLSTTKATINNCDIRADGWTDAVRYTGTHGACAISAESDVQLTINGGYYMGTREALSISSNTRINGGVFDGCQHGGGYLLGKDIKVKNATFRCVPRPDGWLFYSANTYGGAVYSGGSRNWEYDGSVEKIVHIYFDGCYFENLINCSWAVSAKYYNTNLYLSNCTIAGGYGYDLRAGHGVGEDGDEPFDIIYVGKNVVGTGENGALKTFCHANGTIYTKESPNYEWLDEKEWLQEDNWMNF